MLFIHFFHLMNQSDKNRSLSVVIKTNERKLRKYFTRFFSLFGRRSGGDFGEIETRCTEITLRNRKEGEDEECPSKHRDCYLSFIKLITRDTSSTSKSLRPIDILLHPADSNSISWQRPNLCASSFVQYSANRLKWDEMRNLRVSSPPF